MREHDVDAFRSPLGLHRLSDSPQLNCLLYKVSPCTLYLPSECLEALGELIQNNGMSVCQSGGQKTLPLIAAQISDRDNAVHSAALNTMVVVYGNIGETVYRYTAQVSNTA